MTAPAVSVLIAVHNGLPYVESALRSIMDQSLREIEIVVVDDASRDDTPAMIRASIRPRFSRRNRRARG